jgi:putative hemolysin
MQYLRGKYWSDEGTRIEPKVPVSYVDVPDSVNVVLPSLLKRYLNIGAKVCGEPCYDADFNVADIFVLIDAKRMNKRYERHFLYGA